MKHELNDLAILGGKPAFNEFLHVGRPNIGNRARFFDRINEIFDRKWLTNNGPFVQEFEQQISNFLNVKNCVVFCNATIALEIVIRALNLSGEVIVPSFTFVATAHALQIQGITPVFCDIDPNTHNIDPSKLEILINSRTTGILAVHIWGRPCNIHVLTEIANKNNLKLVFDAAHAFGCSFQGCMIGNFGDAEVFSFHATKFLNTFEGGAITTNNDELAKTIRLMKNFGFSGYDNVISLGTNGKMSEISAAMGLTGLESLDFFIQTNKKNYDLYRQHLNGIPGLKLIQYPSTERNNYQYIILEVDETSFGINRDQLVKILHAENILARKYFYPGCHQMEPYRTYYKNTKQQLIETDKLTQRVLSLPNGTSISLREIKKICQIIQFVYINSSSIRQNLI